MNKIQIRVSTLISRLCAFGMAILGFSLASCDSDNGDEPLMYGTPTGTFEVKGDVETEDGADVEGARVVVKEVGVDAGSLDEVGAATTDADGDYSIRAYTFPASKLRVCCYPPEGLEADSVDIDVDYKDGDGAWDWGTAKAEVDFKLKKK